MSKREVRLPRVFAFRLDDETADLLSGVAESYGMKSSEFVRRIVLERIGSMMRTPAVRTRILHAAILRDIAGELGRQGSNLNQIARALNAGRHVSASSLDTAIETQRRALVAVVEALAGTREP